MLPVGAKSTSATSAMVEAGSARRRFRKVVNIVYYHDTTVEMTFFSYTKSGVQAGSAQLARVKSPRVMAGGHAQMLIVRHTRTHAMSALFTPDEVPWPSHEVGEVVDRDRCLPARPQVHAQQLKQSGGELGGKGGWFQPSRTSDFHRLQRRPADPGASI